MTPLEKLESRLLEHWQGKESKKSWREWVQWLNRVGLNIQVNPPSQMSSQQKINYQTFLKNSEEALKHHPEWLPQLTAPSWLISHELIVFPSAFFKTDLQSEHSQPQHLAAVESLKKQVAQISSDMQAIQQRVTLLESRSNSATGAAPQAPPVSMSIKPVKTPSAFPGIQPQMGPEQAQIMEKELTVRHLSQKPKSPPKKDLDEPPPFPKMERLEDIYLSFNEWCDQFHKIDVDLQQLASASIQVPSSHRISFRQFGHRIARKVDDQEKLNEALLTFENKYQDGFIPDLPEDNSADSADELELHSEEKNMVSGSSDQGGFSPPSSDMYQEFNTWLDWLAEQGIDLRNFSSQELTVASSHRISFTQFCKRLERKLDDVEGFRQAVGNA